PSLPAALPIWDRNRREQALRVRVDGVAHDLRGLADLDEVTVAHDGDALGDPFDHRQIMADEQARESVFLLQAFEQVEDLRLHRYVERRGRLVGDEQLRPQGQSAGDADALTLTAGELMGVPVAHRRRQLDRFEQLFDLLAQFRSLHPLMEVERFADRLADRQTRVERGAGVLEDDPDLLAQRTQLLVAQTLDARAVDDHIAFDGGQQTERGPTDRR